MNFLLTAGTFINFDQILVIHNRSTDDMAKCEVIFKTSKIPAEYIGAQAGDILQYAFDLSTQIGQSPDEDE